MNVFHSFAEIAPTRPSVVTIGAFDGLHLGHQHLMRSVVDEAREHRLHSTVVTFHPHPDIVLGRDHGRELTTLEQKMALIADLGVESLVVIAFTPLVMHTPADEFVRLLLHHLRMVSLWIGQDFALGNRRQGTAGYLTERGVAHGFSVQIVPPLEIDGGPVSSTRIRAALARGDRLAAERMLGRPLAET